MLQEMDRERRMLLIVDPQIDFITGSLPVPDAREAMDALARYVREHGHEYAVICITCDCHPLNHSSFSEFGGKWPPHCVRSSIGAAVWPALMEQLPPYADKLFFLYKGEDRNREEYSIFRSENGAEEFRMLMRRYQITHIDICGLAGDVCVKNTLADALDVYPEIHFRVLPEYIASLDGGESIMAMAGERGCAALKNLDERRTGK